MQVVALFDKILSKLRTRVNESFTDGTTKSPTQTVARTSAFTTNKYGYLAIGFGHLTASEPAQQMLPELQAVQAPVRVLMIRRSCM